MNTNKSKPLAKVFGPVLLLSAALSLPVDSFAAPAQKERNAHSERADSQERKANRAEKKNQKQQQVRSNRGEEQRAAAQRQAELNRQRAAERKAAVDQKAAAQRQAEVNRQRAAHRQAEARRAESQRLQQQFEQNRRERQLRESRQVELNRQAELRRQAELQRQAALQRRNSQQRYVAPRNQFGKQYYGTRWYDRSNNRYRNYAGGRSWSRGDTIAVDGYLTDEGYSCQALRDDNGDLYMLVNHTYGLRNGDHARVVGRVVDGGYCDWEGIAFEITDVTALWADRRHQAVYYHQNYDGGQFGDRNNWMGRRPRQFQNRVERFGY